MKNLVFTKYYHRVFSLNEESKINFNKNIMLPQDKHGFKSLNKIKETSMHFSKKIHLLDGDIMIINNKRMLHGRSAYQPKFDGTDRWIQRAYVRGKY